MKFTLLLLTLVLCTGPLFAQGPANWQSAERAKILNGISSVPKPGAPGPVALWGTLAFPVIAAKDGGESELAVMAATGFMKGRAIIYGHTGFISGGGTFGALLVNSLKWVTNQDKPRVGVLGGQVDGFLDSQGLRVEKLSSPLSKGSLSGCDAIVVATATAVKTDEEATLIMTFVKEGGGMVTSMTGWAFEQVSGGKPLHTSPLNQAMMPMGIAFTDASAWGGVGLTSFQARNDLSEMINASAGITAIRKQQSGGTALTPEQSAQASSAIQLALAAQTPGRNSLATAVTSALGEGSSGVPTKEQPLTQDQHASQRIRLGMEARVIKLATGADVKAHPAAEIFPGKVPAGSKSVTKEIAINPAKRGWASTGLYANAGESVTVKVPAAIVGKGYAIRIGCHSDTLFHLDSWKRVPDITRVTPIDAAETKLGSAFGGLVYIVVPRNATEPSAEFSATITGAYEAPLFVLGKDTDETWNQIKTRPAPWAELAGDKMIVSVPTEVARTVKNPTELMQFWDRVVSDQDELTNQATERKGTERMVADVQISAGFMHSGYPIMIHTPEALEMVTYGRIKFPGWGFYHEIGHNHQRDTFTFEGCGEVTNNMIGLYNYAKTLGREDFLMGHGAITKEKRKEYVTTVKKATDKWAAWRSNPFLSLTTYIQLLEGFGWEPMKEYLHSFADTAKWGPAPKTDEETRDQLLLRYSKITKRNLGPFFDAWGIPTSSTAKAEVANLEAWMPKDL
jgi:hypothetical protein